MTDYPKPLTDEPAFVVGVGNPGIRMAKEGKDGPFCECDGVCGAILPELAWWHVGVMGQFVVLPEHVAKGERVVPFDGWCVVEGDL